MNNTPLITLVISTYNHEKYIQECIESVLSQNIDDMEIIILDDCSTDNTGSIIQPYLEDTRITYIRNKKNLGGRKNNSNALKPGKGKYQVWLHGDDYYLDGHLQSHVDALENNPDCSLAYSPCYWVDENSNRLQLLNHPGHKENDYCGNRNELADLLIYDNYITPSSVVFRRSDLEHIGQLHPTIPGADWDLYCRFATQTNGFAFIKQASTMYRIHSEQISVKFYGSDAPVKAHFHVVEQAFESNSAAFLYGFEKKIFDHLEKRIQNYNQVTQAKYLLLFKQLKDKYYPNDTNIGYVCKTSTPLISVIIPTYNRPSLLKFALESIVNQTYQNWEALVINDAGEDVADLVSSIDPLNRIQYICHSENQERSAARNTGISFAKGDIFCYLDDDDTFLPEHLSTVVEELLSRNAGFVYTDATYINENIADETRIEISRATPYSGIEYSAERLNIANFIPINTWAHTRGLLHATSGFAIDLMTYEDWDILLQFSKLVDFIHIPKSTTEVHTRCNSKTDNTLSREQNNLANHCIKLYERHPAESEKIQQGRIKVLASFGSSFCPPTNYSTDIKHSSSLSNIEKASIVAEYTGTTLTSVARALVENKPDLFTSKDKSSQLFIDIANKIDQETIEAESSKCPELITSNRQEAIDLMAEVLDKDSENHQASTIRNRLLEKQQDESHQCWISNHMLREIDGQIFAERMMHNWSQRPVFHCIMFLLPGEDALLANTLDSLSEQMYSEWHLTIISDAAAPDVLWHEMKMLHWVHYQEGENPYELLNHRIANTAGDWLTFIEPGTRLPTHSLIQFSNYINEKSDWKFIYSDEDIIEATGKRKSPHFKPDFNLDMLRSTPYIGNSCFIDRKAFESIGGFEALPSYENHDVALKVFEAYGEDSLGHISDILFHRPGNSTRSFDETTLQQTTRNHLSRSNIPGNVTQGYLPGTVRVNYLHSDTPLVSIIIPNKDKFEYLNECLESLSIKTDYANFEIIIVDNGSTDPDVLSLYQTFKANMGNLFHVFDYPDGFNFSAMCNLGVENSHGSHLLFLNNDTKIIHEEWLSRMMSHIQRSDVGIVGARLIYPETGRIQHAGVVLGLDTVADHPFNHTLSFKEPGYMGRLQIDQNYSAVTGACLLIERDVFVSANGMDEHVFKVSYNDIDLCLKVREMGLRIVWTPYATLIHYGSVSQKSAVNPAMQYKNHERFTKERESMLDKWLHKLAVDSAYNKNLSLKSSDMRTEVNMPINWDTNFHDRSRILGFPLISASGEYRIIHPFNALSHAALLQCEHYKPDRNQTISVTEIARMQPDTLVFQNAFNDKQIELVRHVQKHLPYIQKVFTIDDLLTDIPEGNTSYKTTKRFFRETRSRVRNLLSYCDRLIVSTQPLADEFKDMIDDIKVVPNYLSKGTWLHLRSARNTSEKPRVGWVGAQQHLGDLRIIFDVIKQTAATVDWVFMGMCPEEIKPYVHEYHNFVSIESYPEKMADLNLDLAIAPLEINAFNESKSNLRLLEYGILGWPVICTDIYPYRMKDAPVRRVENTTEAWIDAISEYTTNPSSMAASGDKLRKWVKKHYLLEDHLSDWNHALQPKNLDKEKTKKHHSKKRVSA